MSSVGQTHYDKLRKLETSETLFDFKCPNCKSKDIDISPLDICYRKEIISNEDIKNEKVRKYYDNLPTIQEALLIMSNKDTYSLLCHCKACKETERIGDKVVMGPLRRWIKKTIGEKPMIL